MVHPSLHYFKFINVLCYGYLWWSQRQPQASSHCWLIAFESVKYLLLFFSVLSQWLLPLIIKPSIITSLSTFTDSFQRYNNKTSNNNNIMITKISVHSTLTWPSDWGNRHKLIQKNCIQGLISKIPAYNFYLPKFQKKKQKKGKEKETTLQHHPYLAGVRSVPEPLSIHTCQALHL